MNSFCLYFEIYGTEISREAINIATNYYKLNLNFGYLEDQKLESNTYDVITLWHVLEHLHRPDLMIKECHRLLKNKGVLIIAVPNFNLVFSLLRSKDISIFNHIFKKKYNTDILPDYDKKLIKKGFEIHLTFYTAKTLSSFIKRNGFKIIELSLDDYIPKQDYFTRFFYHFCDFLYKTFHHNLYPTIFLVAEKI